MEVKQPRGGMNRRARVSIFVNVVLICALGALLAFALLWLVNRLTWKSDLRVDLTRDERFSIDPMAESVLRGLTAPVHATFVYGIDDEIRSRALDLARQPRTEILEQYYRPLLVKSAARVQAILGEWAKTSELFTYDAIDAEMDPQRMAEIAQRRGKTAADLVRGINQVVFESGPRRRSVPMGRMFPIDWGFFSPDPRGISKPPEMLGKPRPQSELTETLRALSAGEALKVGVPQGIASALPPDGQDFARIREFLVSQGFEPSMFDLAQGVPKDVGLVLFIGMGRRLLPVEGSELERYERSGGRIILFADWRKPEDFSSLLDPYGVRLEAGRIEDPLRQAPNQPDPSVILSNELCVGDHEIDRPVAQRIGIYVGTTRPLKIENLGASGAERVPLMRMSADAKVVPIEYRQGSGEPDPVPSARRSAPAAAIAAALRRPADGGKESRIVVFGGWEIVSPRPIELGTHYGNRDLVLNSLNWLVDRKGAIGIVEREIAPSRVDLSPGFLSSFRWITMAGMPFLLLLGGVFVWLSRRN